MSIPIKTNINPADLYDLYLVARVSRTSAEADRILNIVSIMWWNTRDGYIDLLAWYVARVSCGGDPFIDDLIVRESYFKTGKRSELHKALLKLLRDTGCIAHYWKKNDFNSYTPGKFQCETTEYDREILEGKFRALSFIKQQDLIVKPGVRKLFYDASLWLAKYVGAFSFLLRHDWYWENVPDKEKIWIRSQTERTLLDIIWYTRASALIGKGTCSCIDETYTDTEVVFRVAVYCPPTVYCAMVCIYDMQIFWEEQLANCEATDGIKGSFSDEQMHREISFIPHRAI